MVPRHIAPAMVMTVPSWRQGARRRSRTQACRAPGFHRRVGQLGWEREGSANRLALNAGCSASTRAATDFASSMRPSLASGATSKLLETLKPGLNCAARRPAFAALVASKEEVRHREAAVCTKAKSSEERARPNQWRAAPRQHMPEQRNPRRG